MELPAGTLRVIEEGQAELKRLFRRAKSKDPSALASVVEEAQNLGYRLKGLAFHEKALAAVDKVLALAALKPFSPQVKTIETGARWKGEGRNPKRQVGTWITLQVFVPLSLARGKKKKEVKGKGKKGKKA